MDTEAIKGRLLSLWLDDLWAEKRPRMAPELHDLSNEDITEVMDLARWCKATYAPTVLTDEALADLKARAREAIAQARQPAPTPPTGRA
jgi:signal transduction histidine kinase